MTRIQKPLNNPRLTCKRATALLAAYLADEIDRRLAAAFAAHLEDCPDCTAFLNTYKRTIQLTRSFVSEEITASTLARQKRRSGIGPAH